MSSASHEEEHTTTPATIYDVAELAGVSASTVSRAFSRPDRVSSRTAEKVRLAAEKLGYGSTPETRRRNTEPTKVLGIIVADLSNPFFHDVLRGVQHAAKLEKYVVMTADTRESVPQAQLAAERMIPLVDALVLASTRLSNGEIQKIARQIPTVVVNRPVQGVPSVLVDNYAGTLRLTQHLRDQQASSITYLSGPMDSWADAVRWRGFLDTADRPDTPVRDGIADPDTLTRTSSGFHPPPTPETSMTVRQLRLDEPTVRGGRRAFEAWREQPTDAVVCFNNMVGAGFTAQARAAGVDIPGDVLVAAFDNTDIASLLTPSLTTIAGPARSIGRVAAANAIGLAKGLKSPLTKPRVLPARLIVRQSSSRARSATVSPDG